MNYILFSTPWHFWYRGEGKNLTHLAEKERYENSVEII